MVSTSTCDRSRVVPDRTEASIASHARSRTSQRYSAASDRGLPDRNRQACRHAHAAHPDQRLVEVGRGPSMKAGQQQLPSIQEPPRSGAGAWSDAGYAVAVDHHVGHLPSGKRTLAKTKRAATIARGGAPGKALGPAAALGGIPPIYRTPAWVRGRRKRGRRHGSGYWSRERDVVYPRTGCLPKTILMGLQHVMAMFGATVLSRSSGIQPEHSHLLQWRGDADLPGHHGLQGAELPGLELLIHRFGGSPAGHVEQPRPWPMRDRMAGVTYLAIA